MATDYHGRIMGKKLTPAQIVEEAHLTGSTSVAYTYTEPTVFFELALEVARRAKQKDLANVFVTNGYMTPEAVEMIQPYLDAANVDLKAFTDEFYRKYCSAKLKNVLATLKEMVKKGIFLEITTLLIPGLNDSQQELKDLASFIANELGEDTPWHVSRFHPTYKLTDRPSTPVETLKTARQTGLDAGLKYVYTGNVPGQATENTYCPGCNSVVIARKGFLIVENRVEAGKCPHCGSSIAGVGL